MINISNKEELRQLIARYLRGQASREEISFLHRYYDHFEDRPNGFNHLTEEERENLKSEIFGAIDKMIENINNPHRPNLWIRRVAAVLVFLILGAAAIWFSPFYVKFDYNVVHHPEQVTETIIMTFNAEEEALHHYLPDGSYVLLEPGSEISYTPRFADEIREVKLVGEAFFDIKHEDDRPFVVLANGVSTRVLGTAFRIVSLKNTNEFSISVTRGRVEISDQDQQLGVLEKNDQMVLDMSTHTIIKTTLEEEQTAVLEPIEYIMDNVSVGKAVDIISKRWDCEFVVPNNDLYSCEFTTSFLPTDGLEEIVTVISAVIGAKFRIEGKIVTLIGEGCIE